MSYKTKKEKEIIRSSKTSLKFANADKKDVVELFLNEYFNVVRSFIDILWNMNHKDISSLLPKEITDQVTSTTWLSARLVQCAGKQASGIVRGTRTKQERRLYQISKFIKEGQFKKARKLKAVYDKLASSKPTLEGNAVAELDSRFVNINLDNDTSFDGWITLSSIGNKIKLELPFKRTKHFNELYDVAGSDMKKGIRLSSKTITFNFGLPMLENVGTKTAGIDIGVKTLLSIYDGENFYSTGVDEHGYDLNAINDILSRRKKGSKGFERAQRHRQNYINRCVKKMPWDGLKTIRIERIKGLRKGKKSSRKLQHFNYRDIFDRMEMVSERLNVSVEQPSPTYTSQRCSCCGWTRKRNRKGKEFKCSACGYATDADLNASRNIQLELPSISKATRLSRPNRLGFYWNVMGQDNIVPDIHKAIIHILL